MENPIVSWLFETDAVRVCPEGQPFWYTSGKLGPFYINTQFLYGSEAAANALLSVIEQACAGDKLAFYGRVYGEIEKQLAACPIYRQLIDLMTEAARKMDVDFISGGERRDFFHGEVMQHGQNVLFVFGKVKIHNDFISLSLGGVV